MSDRHIVIGHKIKGIRESKQLSVSEISERTGLSEAQINSIENDEHLPSLGPLIKVARALGVRLGTFLDDNDELGPVVCRATEREESISFSNDSTGRHMEPFIIDINPNEDNSYKLSAHEGEEFIFVMSGDVEVVYGKETYHLKEGDSIFYDSIVEHHVHGFEGKSAKILAVIYVPI